MVARRLALLLFLAPLLASVAACEKGDGPSLSREDNRRLKVGDHLPDTGERDTCGAIGVPVERGTAAFKRLVKCEDAHVVFKDEEGTGADRMMTPRLKVRLVKLADLVQKRWPKLRLRVTEAWDEDFEHGEGSLHYEGRAADITTSDVDTQKLGELARLATLSGFDWVFFEDASHVHVSVTK